MKEYVVEIHMPNGTITRQKCGSSGDVAAAFAGTIMAQKHAASYNVELVDIPGSDTIVVKVTDR